MRGQGQKIIFDQGQEYVINDTGLIDRNKTEKLFNKRNGKDQ
jgi:hypothetical protein